MISSISVNVVLSARIGNHLTNRLNGRARHKARILEMFSHKDQQKSYNSCISGPSPSCSPTNISIEDEYLDSI